MIDDEPETHRWPEGGDTESPATQSDDPLATRCPEAGDEFATRADAGLQTWADPSGLLAGFGPRPEGVPRYRIIKPHARGALGEVFLAQDEELKREVALKEIQEHYADDACSRTRFVLEAEVTGGLEHPGIVPVYGLGYHPNGRPYYAMRFVRGGSLKEAIDRHYRGDGPRPDPAESALAFRKLLARFIGVCNAIAYAHSRGVLHRDLKPGNVMLGPYGETLVVDWGLAKSMSEPHEESSVSDLNDRPGPLRPGSGESSSPSATMEGSVVGTPAFMSPEQAEGDLDRLGPPSDIYSLGATLYYLLTGKVAFPGKDVDDILIRVRKGEFTPPGKVRKGVPRALEAIALKAMALRPEDRYPNAKALAADVEHWLAGASVSAYRDWYVVKAWRWFLRRPILATAGIACLFFDLCFLVILILALLHAWMPRLNLAVGVLVLSPFVGQIGALLGWSLGAAIGLATRRDLAGLRRGAAVGLKFGVPTALVVLLISGAFELISPPTWTNPANWRASGGDSTEGWPKLPGAVTEPPSWIKKPGTPQEIAAFFDKVPREENAEPSYLDALIEFDDGMVPCFSPEEGLRRGKVARARMEQLESLEKSWRSSPQEVDNDILDLWLDEYKVGFLKLRQAQAFHRCVFQTGLINEAGRPHLEAARVVERVTAFQVRRRLDRGEIDLAIDDFETVLRLLRDVRSRGVLTAQAVALGIESTAEVEIFLPILRQDGLKVEQCDRLLSLLSGQTSRGLDPFLEGVRADYVRFGQTLHGYLGSIGEEQASPGSSRNPLDALFASSRPSPLDRETERKLAALRSGTTTGDFVETAHRVYDDFHRVIHSRRDRPLLERIEHADSRPPRLLAAHHKVLFLAPDVGEFLRAIGKADATRNAMRCLVALRRWELSGRALTTNLDLNDVVKAAGMTRTPPDPFRSDGGPLRLTFAPGTPIIYSVGLGGQDHGGDLDAKPSENPRGNIAYRLKASGDGR